MRLFLRRSGFSPIVPICSHQVLFFPGSSPMTAWRLNTRREEPKPRTQWSAKSETKLLCSSNQLIIQKQRLFWRLLGSWGCGMRLKSPCSAGKIMLNIVREMLMAKHNGDIGRSSCAFAMWYYLYLSPHWSSDIYPIEWDLGQRFHKPLWPKERLSHFPERMRIQLPTGLSGHSLRKIWWDNAEDNGICEDGGHCSGVSKNLPDRAFTWQSCNPTIRAETWFSTIHKPAFLLCTCDNCQTKIMSQHLPVE